MIVLLKAKANANKISLFFPSTVLSLNNPDNIRNFVQELTKHFMTDKTIQVGAKHDFNIRKVTRLQNHLTIKISNIPHDSYTKMNKNSHICPFCPFVLLESRKNIGRFEKNISMIEIKHWDISIQISQCFFFIFVCLNTSLYVKLGNINDLHRQLI